MFIIIRNKESPESNSNTSNFFEFHFVWRKTRKGRGSGTDAKYMHAGRIYTHKLLQWPMDFQGWTMFYMHVAPLSLLKTIANSSSDGSKEGVCCCRFINSPT